MRTHGRINFWLCGLFLWTASSAFAAEWQAVLGAGGEMYVAKTGAYGQLFPGVRPADAANRVLVLEVTPPGEPTRRILVPGTDDAEEEKAPAMIYEDRSQTVYLVWQSQFSIHPILRLTAYDGEWWPKPLEITGNPFAPKTSPQLALTRDSYKEMVTPDELVTRHRTMLHLLWEEEAAGGMLETFYSPIVFVDGVYIGRNPVFQLDEFLQSEEANATAALTAPSSLVRSPTIQSGRDGRTVVIAYVSSVSGRLVSVEVDALPQELGHIGDKARSHIIDLGRELRDLPRDLPAIAGKARSHIIDLGRAFHREIIDSVAAQVYTKIVESDETDIESIADTARSHIIDLGAKLSARGLRNPGKAPAKIAEIASPASGEDEGGTMLLQIRAASSRPAPQIDAAEPVVFLSESGEEVLIAWQDHKQNRVFYRDTKGDDWNGVREIKLSDSLPLSRAYEVLRQRVRNR